MGDAKTGQVSQSAAEVYDEQFVPALFGPWAPRVAGAASVAPGDRVLDVACGTGALTRELANAVGPGGTVVGIDRNAGMLDVAARKAPRIQWDEGMAEELPYDDASFDVVTCQFSLMFFEDPVKALQQMWRVLAPGGRLTVALWDQLENVPGYVALTDLLSELFSDEHAEALRAPYRLGDPKTIESLLHEAGIPEARITIEEGTLTYPSVNEWMHLDVKGWTLADMVDQREYEVLVKAANERLQPFVNDHDGSVSTPHNAVFVTATKPG